MASYLFILKSELPAAINSFLNADSTGWVFTVFRDAPQGRFILKFEVTIWLMQQLQCKIVTHPWSMLLINVILFADLQVNSKCQMVCFTKQYGTATNCVEKGSRFQIVTLTNQINSLSANKSGASR